jgi:hypothetical protein
MFMFRRKRALLTQRLLKARKLDATDEDALQTQVLAQLADQQLELLLRAVERGDARTCCVPAPPRRRQQQQQRHNADAPNATSNASSYCCCASGESPPPGASRTGHAPPPPHVLCCQTYRWPQLTPDTQLKRLPQCSTCDLDDCCNPFHWSKVCGPGQFYSVFVPCVPFRTRPVLVDGVQTGLKWVFWLGVGVWGDFEMLLRWTFIRDTPLFMFTFSNLP